MIKRDVYLNQLIAKQGSSKIKIITGLRRCGKSYLLSKLYTKYLIEHGVKKKNIILVELDDIKNDYLLKKGEIIPYIEKLANKKNEKYYIFLDEIQLMEDFVRSVNSLNKHANYDVYITGSNSKFLSKDINDEFKDRGTEINIRPLSFSEFYPAYKGDKRNALNEYLKFGGMPGLFEEENEISKIKYLNNLMSKVYIDDVKRNVNTPLTEELSSTVDALCSVTGSLTNPTNLANYLKSNKKIKINYQTIDKFFNGLVDAYLFDKAYRYDIKGKQYLDTPFKFYCEDIGLRNARLNFREPNLGFLIENAVFNELKTRGYLVDVGFYSKKALNKNGKRTNKQVEVDFIARFADKEYYLQVMDEVPNGQHKSNEYNALLGIRQNFKKIIIVNKLINSFTNEDGILIISLEEFLINTDSLKL